MRLQGMPVAGLRAARLRDRAREGGIMRSTLAFLAMSVLATAGHAQSPEERRKFDNLKNCVAASVVVVDPVNASPEDWSRRKRTRDQAFAFAKGQGVAEAQFNADVQKTVGAMTVDKTARFYWAACKATVK